MERDPEVIKELKYMIVIPESFHFTKDLTANTIEEAYNKYFQMVSDNRLKIEKKKYDLCISALNTAKKRMEVIFYDNNYLIDEIQKIIDALLQLRSKLENDLYHKLQLENLNIF